MPLADSTILVVDDDRANLDSVARIFQHEGMATLTASDGEEGLALLRRPEVGVLVTDLMMPGLDGKELLRTARSMRPDVQVVLMTAYGTVEAAVSAMKDGAYDFITKPLKRHALVKTVQRALEHRALMAENEALKARLADLGAPGGRTLIGQSPAFRALMETLRQAAAAHATVLLVGESGTGKELAARALHELSPRANGPFVAINCGAIPETLIEAELFGVEKGAFTGALARREGRFERAHGGTVFLDEVGELSLGAQVKLLRVLQEGEIERLGGSGPLAVDVRVVSATRRELPREVAENRFREDLYYRLNVVEVRIPPLASRREDVPLLADHFLRRFAAKNTKPLRGFSAEAAAGLGGLRVARKRARIGARRGAGGGIGQGRRPRGGGLARFRAYRPPRCRWAGGYPHRDSHGGSGATAHPRDAAPHRGGQDDGRSAARHRGEDHLQEAGARPRRRLRGAMTARPGPSGTGTDILSEMLGF